MGIGKRIRKYRQEKKIKGKELADIINISQSALSDIENEHNKPSADTIVAIVKKTDINPYWLLTGEGDLFSKELTHISNLLKDIIEKVEKISIKNQFSQQPHKKAELITLLFEELAENKTKRQDLEERILRLMKLF